MSTYASILTRCPTSAFLYLFINSSFHLPTQILAVLEHPVVLWKLSFTIPAHINPPYCYSSLLKMPNIFQQLFHDGHLGLPVKQEAPQMW